jgi:hypothetical protein
LGVSNIAGIQPAKVRKNEAIYHLSPKILIYTNSKNTCIIIAPAVITKFDFGPDGGVTFSLSGAKYPCTIVPIFLMLPTFLSPNASKIANILTKTHKSNISEETRGAVQSRQRKDITEHEKEYLLSEEHGKKGCIVM